MIIHLIQLNGKIEFDLPEGEKIETDTEYALMVDRIENKDGAVSKRIRDDRTEFTYKMVPKGMAVLSAGNKVFKGKSKSSTPSQVLRFAIEDLRQARYSDRDPEEFYNEWMSGLIEQVKYKLNG
jgi:hypothetical protein